MIIDVVMPKMGESITEGTILEWKKQVGDSIAMDEILLEIGTDKVDSEIPSSAEGVIVEILAKPNDVIEVGKVIAKIDSEKESYKSNDFIEKSKFEKVFSRCNDSASRGSFSDNMLVCVFSSLSILLNE